MKRWMRTGVLLLAVLTVFLVPAMAYEIPTDFTDQTLDQIMEAFLQANGLNEQNFSVSYVNTVTGETYGFNDTTMMVAASTFKVPLNMYYYELEQEKLISPDAYISRVGDTLANAHRKSLVDSNNEVSIGMLYNLGEFRDYKNLMKKYFTMTDEEIDPKYYVDNYYCTRMMTDALSYLYEYRADFTEMLGYMKEAQPGEYFKAGVPDYEVAHKYGWFEGAINDVGIIYAPQPFLLAVYTQDLTAQVVADTAALFTAYNVWQNPPEPEDDGKRPLDVTYVPLNPQETRPEPQTPDQPEPEPEPHIETKPGRAAFAWWMIPVALGVFLMGGGVVLVTVKPKQLIEQINEADRKDEEAWEEAQKAGEESPELQAASPEEPKPEQEPTEVP